MEDLRRTPDGFSQEPLFLIRQSIGWRIARKRSENADIFHAAHMRAAGNTVRLLATRYARIDGSSSARCVICSAALPKWSRGSTSAGTNGNRQHPIPIERTAAEASSDFAFEKTDPRTVIVRKNSPTASALWHSLSREI
jgi:hypothetical protein